MKTFFNCLITCTLLLNSCRKESNNASSSTTVDTLSLPIGLSYYVRRSYIDTLGHTMVNRSYQHFPIDTIERSVSYRSLHFSSKDSLTIQFTDPTQKVGYYTSYSNGNQMISLYQDSLIRDGYTLLYRSKNIDTIYAYAQKEVISKKDTTRYVYKDLLILY